MAPRARSLKVQSLVVSLSALLLAVNVAFADDGPPSTLHLEGDHWTAWDAPSEYPEGADVHIIERGDTLWDLAAQFLGDPYLWPQLWERNQYIRDAHWIYPGDGLVISVEVVPVETLAQATEMEALPSSSSDDGAGTGASERQAPMPLGSESDIYCSGFIGPDKMEFPYEIVGSEAAALAGPIYGERKPRKTEFGVATYTLKNDLATSDIVYLDGGRDAGLSAGSMFTMVQVMNQVRHPLTRQVVGRFNRYLGRVRVLSVQEDTAIAEIMESCHPAQIGAKLMPFVPEPVPLGRYSAMRPINQPAPNDQLDSAAAIIYVDFDYLSLGEGNVVFIDRGAADDVTPGDVFTIYRMNTPGLPAVVMGELAVLSVHSDTSLARILSSRYTVRVGDRLELK